MHQAVKQLLGMKNVHPGKGTVYQNLCRFLVLFKINLLAYLKNYVGVFFGMIFPIIWLVASYYIWGKYSHPAYFVNTFVAFSLLPTASLGLVTFPMNFGLDRITNQNKIYATLNVSQERYFLSQYLVIFLAFFITTNLMLLIGNFAFVGDAHKAWADLIPAREYFAVFFTDFFIFTLCFIFSLGLSRIGNTTGKIFSCALAYYYVSIFISGVMIPAYAYDAQAINNPKDNWFKWLQYITPIGSGARLDGNIVNPQAWTWDTDWLCFVSPMAQAGVILFLVTKFSYWRYHRNTSRKRWNFLRFLRKDR